MKQKIILASTLVAPPLMMQIWQANYQLLGTMLLVVAVFSIALLVCLVLGIRKRNVYLILALPTFLFSLALCFKIVNVQSKSNEKNSEKLIAVLEDYKAKTGAYPNQISQLKPAHMKDIPMQWYMLKARDYDYSFDRNNKSFSIKIYTEVNATSV